MNIALTGATGFLGLRLLRCLLERHGALTLLTHSASADALGRVTRFLEATGAPERLIAELPARVRVVPTDLSRPRMGLPTARFEELADACDAIWHSAGSINLEGDLASLRRVNVEGTRAVLELAAAGPRRPVIYHVSTAFVAGARREGVVYEDELDDAHGFENSYERSKYEAEALVHAWARTHRSPVVVLRPSILVTDLPPHPELPRHPLQVMDQLVGDAMHAAGLAGKRRSDPGLPVMRLVGRRYGHLNMMPVEDAATAMVRLADREPSGRVDTYHVVHDHDVPVCAVTELMERLAPLRARLVDRRPDDVSALEASMDFYPGITPYLRHHRRYDDTRARTVLGPPRSVTRVDVDYLLSGLRPARPAWPTDAPAGGPH
ncbi:SDR family oxidoreductase [Streptomyces lancefieldiae]|uniref:SDR family oxidoreductase n=1 Tax=Streptomyces lancefieldiae TaxID=3075520 RepID=A0ABU3AG45_9ACTN|nr:SDR family oxidoreductase [Streptomyces sp. DSM 40712]MDT0609145.1 SDR family oxidoreductase [Streptomyces sp. DSM 40712]